MAKNVLFLIHGVGQHPENWAEIEGGPLHALQEASQRYSFFKGKSLTDFIDFVPIRYDDIFDKVLDRWSDMSSKLQGLTAGAPEITGTTLDLLGRAGNDKNQILRIGGDVPLYKNFRLFSQQVQARVMGRIAEVVADRTAQASGTPPKFSLMAHSLGTTVAHDSLQHLGTEKWPSDVSIDEENQVTVQADEQAFKQSYERLVGSGKENPFRPGVFHFDRIYMVSNTSRLLHTTQEGPGESIVRPTDGSTAKAYCNYFINVDHEFDPISKVMKFDLPESWNQGRSGQSAVVNHLHDFNVHGYAHYLMHPRVHLSLLAGLVNGFRPTREEIKAAQEFPRIGARFKQEQRELIERKLKELVGRAIELNSEPIKRWLETYGAVLDIAAELRG